MRFVDKYEVRSRLEGKSVAIVGSGPGVLDNKPGYIDGHDVVVRINNYKLSDAAGHRTDVHYSFYGRSIKKTAKELQRDGVTLCMCKCPNADGLIKSDWHRKRGKMNGVNYRWIYQNRAAWWFCDTFYPSNEEFLAGFDLLGGHIPTSGFAAVRAVLSCYPLEAYMTGFDFFRSGKHNVDEKWNAGDVSDPIRHLPERELAWLKANVEKYPLSFDPALTREINADAMVAA